MKKYIFSGAALLMGVLASPGYSATIILAFDDGPNPSGLGTITYTPTGGSSNPTNPATLNSFLNIPFKEVTISGDPIAGDNGIFTYTPSGTAFSFITNSLQTAGSFTTPSGTASGTLVAASGPSVLAYVTQNFADIEVGFTSSTSVSLTNASFLTALGITGPATVTLVQDTLCQSPPGGTYPITTGMACAAGYNASNGNSAGGVDSQYLEVRIDTTPAPPPSTPEPATSLMLGVGLVAVGSLARKRRQKV